MIMSDKKQIPEDPGEPKTDEVAPAVENFNDADDNQVINTGNDAFDEAEPATEDKTPVKDKVLPPGSTDMPDDGSKPVLNKDDKSL